MTNATRHPTSFAYPHGDHRALAAYWGEQAACAIRRAVALQNQTTIEDFNLLHAVRCARIAAHHAFSTHQDLRPPHLWLDNSTSKACSDGE